MFIATVVFWAGRQKYVIVPPAPPDPHSFLRVARTRALTPTRRSKDGPASSSPRSGARSRSVSLAAHRIARLRRGLLPRARLRARRSAAPAPGLQLERARGAHPDEAVDGVRAVLRILVVFALVTPFWSLFDQKASTWVLQADQMTKPAWFSPAQMQALNPALVMMLIPFNNLVLYPALRRLGVEPTALRRMSTGIAFSRARVDRGRRHPARRSTAASRFPIVWQILPYALLTFGEVLVSATGLEFAYSQAPPSMKGVIMASGTCRSPIGNLWVLLVNASVRNEAVMSRSRAPASRKARS